MIKGNLASFSLGEIFQSLAVNGHSGTLKIRLKDGGEKYVYFSTGEICLFSDSSHPSLRLGEILVRQGKLTREDLDSALEYQKTRPERLGKVLVKKFGLSPEDIQGALEAKIYDEIYDLFLLSEAEFEFLVDHFSEEVFEEFPDNARIAINTYSVVIEGLRVADEWKLIKKRIKTFNEIFSPVDRSESHPFDSPMERAMASLLDGRSSVRALFNRFPGSRFDCCKTIFGLLTAGLTRPLTLKECKERGVEARKTGQLEDAFSFLQFAVELSPGRPEPLVLLGEFLNQTGRPQEGAQSLLQAAEIYHGQGNHKEVLRICEPLLKEFLRNQNFLEIFFHAALHLKKTHFIDYCGDALADLLQAEGAKSKAADTLSKVCEHNPKSVDRKLRAANLYRESGDTEKAVTLLEEVASLYNARTRTSDRVKILRSIFEIAPDRQDIKQEINNLLELQQRWEHRKKRRFTIAGVVLICSLLLLVIPLLYEVKARELYSHAKRLEEISRTSGDYSVARTAFQELLDSYGLSTRAPKAREALDRLDQLEREQQTESDAEKRRIAELHELKIREMHDALTNLLKLARTLEEQGNYEEAFNVLQRISREFPEIPRTKLIILPITITSKPSGCHVIVNGDEVGTTPVVIRKKNGEKIAIHVSRLGCEPIQRTVTVGDHWRVNFDMDLRPLSEYKLSGPIHQPVRLVGDRLFLVSRDGHFYCLDPVEQSVRWRRLVGKYGDLVSNPAYHEGEIFLGNVNGEVAAFSQDTGKSRWRTLLSATVLATPAISPDGRWVAIGDLEGRVVLLDNGTGELKSVFDTENEVLRGPRFWRDLLVAASEDNTLYLLSVPDARLVHAEVFAHDVDAELVISERQLFCVTRDGSLHRFDLEDRERKWSRKLAERTSNQPLLVGETIFVGTTGGKVMAFRRRDGERLWELKISNSEVGDFLFRNDRLYMGTSGGEILGVHTGLRKLEWVFRFNDSVTQAPVVVDHTLHFASTNGKFVVMEAFE